VSMYDDLDPQFMSSPGAALPIVAARVWEIRKRRMVVVGSVCGAILIVMFGSVAFGGGGKSDRLTVAREVTTTTDDSSTSDLPLVTAPTTTATSTTTTTAPASTTSTLPIAPDTTATSPKTTTTVATPAHLAVSFDRDRLVIQSGTRETITYTVTNDGGRRGEFEVDNPKCVLGEPVWPDEFRVDPDPFPWPSPATRGVDCQSLHAVFLDSGGSYTRSMKVVAGAYDVSGHLVPAPPGHASVQVGHWVEEDMLHSFQLSVTITPPATPPLTIDHPSEVTTASGAQNYVDFTITNNLAFPVKFVDQGPCSPDGDTLCKATTPDGTFTGDLRVPPYATAVKPLYLTTFTLQAHESMMVRAAVHGTTNLWDSGTGNSDLPPGGYSFDWDGEKIKFTVTP
jgi:hypothetical protein